MNIDQNRTLERAEDLMRAGRPDQALPILDSLARSAPNAPQAWWALGNAYQMVGDARRAEMAFRQITKVDAGAPFGWAALGDLLADTGRGKEAERAWRSALKADRRHGPAAVALAEYLASEGRAREGLQVLTPLLSARQEPRVLAARARVLGALGRHEEALEDYRAATRLSGGAAGPEFELAAALAEAGKTDDAVAAARRALHGGLQAPEVFQTMGHALRLGGRLEEAEAALRQGLEHWPADRGLNRELAHLVWLRTGDVERSTSMLDWALAINPGDPGLLVAKAKVLEYAGDTTGARAVLEEAAGRNDAPPFLLCAIAQVATADDPEAAVAFARRAVDQLPEDRFGLAVLAESQLAAGDAAAAAETAERLLAIAPSDQHGTALLATAWRQLHDPRYQGVFDYGRLVSEAVIARPEGWESLDAFLADLAGELHQMHTTEAHPIGQSIRGGTQTGLSLERNNSPAIRAFFKAADPLIRTHIAKLRGRRGEDDYRLSGAWSVRLRTGGRHVDHVHQAWISSVFYVELPPETEGQDRAGWLRMGEPGVRTTPSLAAEHWVRPQPGKLVLFPSYMWHGTEPFESDRARLTIAFDVAPA